MRAVASAAPANYLLAALPRAAYRGMLARLEAVPLELGQTLHEAGTSLRHVYFPMDSMVSLMSMTLESNRLEVGMVGREGMVGCSVALGLGVSPTRALVQGAGMAMRMSATDLSRELQRSSVLRREVLRSAGVQMTTAMQIAACNNAHSLQSRLARWLLMTRDRLATLRFALTQEFLAQMLGMRRGTVNAGARAFQDAELISYTRGIITIRDLDGLREVACSCYESIRRLTERVNR